MKPKNNNTILTGIVLAALVILLASMTIPVGDSKDVFLRVTVEKPICLPLLCSDDTAKITEVTGYYSPHTLFEAPNLASLISSGKIRIDAEAGTAKKSVKFDTTVLKGTSNDYTLVLKDVKNLATATVKLYEKNDAGVYVNTDTKTITLLEK